MKSLPFILVFSWTSAASSVDQISLQNYGHWPILEHQKIIAVIPVVKNEITNGEDDSNDLFPSLDPQRELFYSCIAGTVALLPHFCIGYYW